MDIKKKKKRGTQLLLQNSLSSLLVLVCNQGTIKPTISEHTHIVMETES